MEEGESENNKASRVQDVGEDLGEGTLSPFSH